MSLIYMKHDTLKTVIYSDETFTWLDYAYGNICH